MYVRLIHSIGYSHNTITHIYNINETSCFYMMMMTMMLRTLKIILCATAFAVGYTTSWQ